MEVRGFYLVRYKTTQDGFFVANSNPCRVFYNNKNVTGNDVTMTFGIRYWISKQEFVIHDFPRNPASPLRGERVGFWSGNDQDKGERMQRGPLRSNFKLEFPLDSTLLPPITSVNCSVTLYTCLMGLLPFKFAARRGIIYRICDNSLFPLTFVFSFPRIILDFWSIAQSPVRDISIIFLKPQILTRRIRFALKIRSTFCFFVDVFSMYGWPQTNKHYIV